MTWSRFALLLAALLSLSGPLAAQQLTVMSLNVRFPNPGDGADVWENRRDHMIDIIRDTTPDLIGTQELFQRQGDDIVAALPQYRWFGMDRRGGHADEHMGIFYRHDRLQLIESGQIALSDNPDVPGSISWGHPIPRMLAWGLFETRDGKRFRLYDTHFPHQSKDEEARIKAARQIAQRIADDDGLPAILTGDFNTGPDSEAHAVLTRELFDSWQFAPRTSGPVPGFHGFQGGTPDRRIDWILLRGFSVTSTDSIAAARDGHYPSDHYPLLATLRWVD